MYTHYDTNQNFTSYTESIQVDHIEILSTSLVYNVIIQLISDWLQFPDWLSLKASSTFNYYRNWKAHPWGFIPEITNKSNYNHTSIQKFADKWIFVYIRVQSLSICTNIRVIRFATFF